MAISIDVNIFLEALDHPFRKEIDVLRRIILAAVPDLKEDIKWNGPNYTYIGSDLITMRVNPPKMQVQLIFHQGHQKKMQPSSRLIDFEENYLTWKENDRAVATFTSIEQIEINELSLSNLIRLWIKASKET